MASPKAGFSSTADWKMVERVASPEAVDRHFQTTMGTDTAVALKNWGARTAHLERRGRFTRKGGMWTDPVTGEAIGQKVWSMPMHLYQWFERNMPHLLRPENDAALQAMLQGPLKAWDARGDRR